MEYCVQNNKYSYGTHSVHLSPGEICRGNYNFLSSLECCQHTVLYTIILHRNNYLFVIKNV